MTSNVLFIRHPYLRNFILGVFIFKTWDDESHMFAWSCLLKLPADYLEVDVVKYLNLKYLFKYLKGR